MQQHQIEAKYKKKNMLILTDNNNQFDNIINQELQHQDEKIRKLMPCNNINLSSLMSEERD